MLNTATPILQMKISGIPLSSLKTMIVTIRSVNYTIVKGNTDIEVDNDVASVFLTQGESEKIDRGNYNISIIAENINGENVSGFLKVMWVKRGSMSKASGGGGGSDADLSDYYTKGEVDILVSNIPGGADGFSPIATVSKSDGVTTISITDKNGTKTVQVLDGINGVDGITPHIGSNGNWFIGNIDTNVKAEGIDGTDGKDGIDGFSPTITENSGNNSNTYKLDITTKDGSFTTPNLKGKDGDGSGGADSSGGDGLFAFEIREDGHLWVMTDSETQANNFSIDNNGHLIYTLEG